MWEEWRAEIDRSLREGALAQTARDHVHLADLKVYRVTALRKGGDGSRELPRSWKVRIADARMRPIL